MIDGFLNCKAFMWEMVNPAQKPTYLGLIHLAKPCTCLFRSTLPYLLHVEAKSARTSLSPPCL